MADSNHTPLAMDIAKEGDAATVYMKGEIDIDNCDQFGDGLNALIGATRVGVDLGEVEYMDSSGLRAFLGAKAAIEQAGGTLEICGASSIVSRLFEITGLGNLLPAPD